MATGAIFPQKEVDGRIFPEYAAKMRIAQKMHIAIIPMRADMVDGHASEHSRLTKALNCSRLNTKERVKGE